MANRFKGEASATLDGVTYTLRLDFNAMCAFEEATGRDAMEALAGFEAGKAKAGDLRALVWAMLQRHHPDADLTLAGDLLSEDAEVMGRVLLASMPQADAGNVKGRKGRAAA